MKQSKALLLIIMLTIGSIIQSFAQEILPEVTVVATRYKYLKSVGDKDDAQPVKLLQRQVAAYNVKNAEFYEDEYDTYFVSFYLPEGKILAAYDKDGRLLRTAEKFKNVALPKAVRQSVAARFPQWSISKDVYLVNYYDSEGSKKTYKLLLENGDQRLKVKTNEKGEFL